MKLFFWKDKTGRGFTEKFYLEDIQNNYDPDNPDVVSYDGESLQEWAEKADESDEWENAANHYICIEVNDGL